MQSASRVAVLPRGALTTMLGHNCSLQRRPMTYLIRIRRRMRAPGSSSCDTKAAAAAGRHMRSMQRSSLRQSGHAHKERDALWLLDNG